MANAQQIKLFISTVAPKFQQCAAKYGFKICSFAIAQACYESGYGLSYDAINLKNILGIGPHKVFSSWDACIEAYYTGTVLGKMDAAKKAASLDEYYKAFVASGYCPGTEAQYYSAVKSIISSNNLTQYDGTNSSKRNEFVQKAVSYDGTYGSQWKASHPKWFQYNAWCSEFVSGVGEDVGILGKLFDGGYSASDVGKSVLKYGGTIHTDKSYTPKPGDLAIFHWASLPFCAPSWPASHIGIVTRYANGVVYCVEGNTGGNPENKVGQFQYDRNKYANITAFCSMNWAKVGDGKSPSGFYIDGTLFEELNTRKDAIAREVCYLNSIYDNNSKTIKEYEATAAKTNIKLSVINYTELFQAFWDAGIKTLSASLGTEYDYSKLEPKAREVVQYLVGKGLNNAGACGICGNIYYESSFRTEAVGDGGTSFGICQWHLGRGDKMKQMAGANWANNLTGQLNYLWYELENSYSGVLSAIKNVPNTEAGARSAADVFVRRFEIPANVDYQSKIRQNKAAEYFNQIVAIVNSSDEWANSANLANLSAKRKAIVQAAYEVLNAKTPYVWGGEVVGRGMDCSGLTQYCYSKAGIYIGHQSEVQYSQAPHRLAVSQAYIGDILWRNGHVAIYIGDGKTIEEWNGGPQNTFANPGGLCSIQNSTSQFAAALHWDI